MLLLLNKKSYYAHTLLLNIRFNTSACRSSVRQRRNPSETADLTSIQELIDDIEGNCHSGNILIIISVLLTVINLSYVVRFVTCVFMYVCAGLLEIVRHCTYIGMADDVFALLQHNTHLYLANVVNLR